MDQTLPKVSVILVNYNRWQDTIECLESLQRSHYPNFQIIVVENGSENNSLSNLQSWAKGSLSVCSETPESLRKFVSPPLQKPIPYLLYQYADGKFGSLSDGSSSQDVPLIFISLSPNKGFASGNNVGIRYALAKTNAEYCWILNNDTVVPPESLSELVFHAENSKSRKAGMIGSKLFYYHNPEILQAVGGKYNKWLATSKHIGAFQKDMAQFDHSLVDMDYMVCASVLVSRSFVEDVGLMDERYILYFEDLDWSVRAKQLGWKLELCPKSHVFHKEGESKGVPKAKSDLVDYYHLKNRFVFTRKFYPYLLAFIHFSLFAILWRRIKRKKYRMAWQVFRFMFFNFKRS